MLPSMPRIIRFHMRFMAREINPKINQKGSRKSVCNSWHYSQQRSKTSIIAHFPGNLLARPSRVRVVATEDPGGTSKKTPPEDFPSCSQVTGYRLSHRLSRGRRTSTWISGTSPWNQAHEPIHSAQPKTPTGPSAQYSAHNAQPSTFMLTSSQHQLVRVRAPYWRNNNHTGEG